MIATKKGVKKADKMEEKQIQKKKNNRAVTNAVMIQKGRQNMQKTTHPENCNDGL
jgi:hypothetical protein